MILWSLLALVLAGVVAIEWREHKQSCGTKHAHPGLFSRLSPTGLRKWLETTNLPVLQVTFSVIVHGGFGVFFVQGYHWLPDDSIHRLTSPVFFAVCLFTFIAASFSSPGPVPAVPAALSDYSKPTGTQEDPLSPPCLWSAPARAWLPPGAPRSCRVCRGCYPGWDHHCVWINTCVARANRAIFLAFVIVHAFMTSYGSYVMLCVMHGIATTGLGLDTATEPHPLTGAATPLPFFTRARVLMSHAPLLSALTILIHAMALVVGAFAAFHVYLAVSRRTTAGEAAARGACRVLRRESRVRGEVKRALACEGKSGASEEEEVGDTLVWACGVVAALAIAMKHAETKARDGAQASHKAASEAILKAGGAGSAAELAACTAGAGALAVPVFLPVPAPVAASSSSHSDASARDRGLETAVLLLRLMHPPHLLRSRARDNACGLHKGDREQGSDCGQGGDCEQGNDCERTRVRVARGREEMTATVQDLPRGDRQWAALLTPLTPSKGVDPTAPARFLALLLPLLLALDDSRESKGECKGTRCIPLARYHRLVRATSAAGVSALAGTPLDPADSFLTPSTQCGVPVGAGAGAGLSGRAAAAVISLSSRSDWSTLIAQPLSASARGCAGAAVAVAQLWHGKQAVRAFLSGAENSTFCQRGAQADKVAAAAAAAVTAAYGNAGASSEPFETASSELAGMILRAISTLTDRDVLDDDAPHVHTTYKAAQWPAPAFLPTVPCLSSVSVWSSPLTPPALRPWRLWAPAAAAAAAEGGGLDAGVTVSTTVGDTTVVGSQKVSDEASEKSLASESIDEGDSPLSPELSTAALLAADGSSSSLANDAPSMAVLGAATAGLVGCAADE